jgi:hypothetical protein
MAGQGSGAKNAGAKFERDTAKILGAWWGFPFHRTPGSGSLHWSKSNNVAGDIVTPPEANCPYSIECKHHNSEWTLENAMMNTGDIKHWWSQCVSDALSVDKVPMLIFKRNRSKTFVALPYSSKLERYVSKSNTKLIPYMTTQIEYKDNLGRLNRYLVLILTQEAMVETPKETFVSISVHKDWKDWVKDSRISADYVEEDHIAEEDYSHSIDNLLSGL